jgi:hypothetical protein
LRPRHCRILVLVAARQRDRLRSGYLGAEDS